jgi:methionyl aminopeptidase
MAQKPKTEAEIIAMRTSGRILAEVLEELATRVEPGITTRQLDNIAQREIKARGGKSAFLGYNGFPASLCVSINDEVVHGIPGKREVAEGDTVNLDTGVVYDGMVTDSGLTVPVGAVPSDVERLLQATQDALQAGIAQVREGARVGDISAAVERVLRAAELGVIEDLCGHGVGHGLHEDPLIPNLGPAGKGPVLRAGMTLAIEPMATLGRKEVGLQNDGWTFVTVDGSRAAQFEHTILVTQTGAEILTKT